MVSVGSRWRFVSFPSCLQSRDITVDFPFFQMLHGKTGACHSTTSMAAIHLYACFVTGAYFLQRSGHCFATWMLYQDKSPVFFVISVILHKSCILLGRNGRIVQVLRFCRFSPSHKKTPFLLLTLRSMLWYLWIVTSEGFWSTLWSSYKLQFRYMIKKAHPTPWAYRWGPISIGCEILRAMFRFVQNSHQIFFKWWF
jgi:hypothetical protein